METASLATYFNRYRELKGGGKKVKVALLASFTIQGLKEVLAVKCAEWGVEADIYIPGYNQYRQEILDSGSGLYQFDPDVMFLFVTEIQKDNLIELVEAFKSQGKGVVVVHNFEVPVYSPLGILENKQPHGIIESVQEQNRQLEEHFRQDKSVFVFDYDAFCSKVGKRNLADPKMYYLGDFRLDMQKFPQLADEYMGYLIPLLQLNKKCLVLDLDDTLWGGVVGEDGLEGIKLGPTPEGRPYWEFQKLILALFQRGVILSINSRNNEADALKVLREHPYMVLKESHFAAMQINWEDKIANMQALRDELNIGMDSLVFIDNDKLNREIVKKALPEVYVVEMPSDASRYVETLKELKVFNTLQLTQEDLKRGELYAKKRERKGFSLQDYLKDLNMVVTIAPANAFSIPRISQLTLKTNQFNMTTRRYSEKEIEQLSKEGRVFSVHVKDKWDDHGIVGVLIVEKSSDKWRIDTFLLSCRVIGRGIEDQMVAFVIKQAGAAKVIGEFIPTEKNAPAKGFYEKQGFKKEEAIGPVEIWSYRA